MASRLSIPVSCPPPAIARTGSTPSASVPVFHRLQGYSWFVVGYTILVILWGTVVRATGSGNGCGDHWPLCGGTLVQHWKTLASVIEFAHRVTSGLDGPAVVALVGWTWWRMPRRHLARVSSAVALVLTLTEGLLGALLVLLHHTGTDQSPMRAFWLSLHLTNTLLLLASLALTAHLLGRAAGRMRGGVELRHGLTAFIGLAATLCVGVSGSLAALGDTLYPAHSLAQAFAQDLAPHGNWLLHIRWVHPMLSLFAAAWILFLVAMSRRSGSGRLGGFVAAMVAVQIALGIADVLLLAPTWLQVTHLLGADVLWVSLIVLTARLCIRPLGCMGAGCTAGKPVQRAASPAPASVTTGA